jgi:uncharacterized protein (TIGR03663 family)
VPRLTVEHALYGFVLVVAFGLRIWGVGARAMHGDEAVHAWLAWNLFTGTGYQYDPVYHGPLQFPVTAFFFFLFGVSNTSGRLMALFFGTALVALPYFFRREFGRTPALLAAAFIALSPAFVYDSRLERDDIFTSLFAMTLAIGIWGYLRTRRPRYIYLCAASIALSLCAMENTYITVFVFGSFVLIALASEWLLNTRLGERLTAFWRQSGEQNRLRPLVLPGVIVLLLAAFLLTVATGMYVPVPLVLGLLLVALVNRQTMLESAAGGGQRFLDALASISRTTWINALTIVVSLLFLFFSTFGSNLHGIWDGTQIINSGSACPGNSFPLNPCRKDIIGGLFYWLSQHKVARGGQPWFYYPLLYGLYEQIAVVFGVAGILWYLRRPTMFTAFLTYWAVLMFGIYSWAGEKFPWLTIHPLLPFLLLGAMFVVDMVRRPGIVRYIVLIVGALLAVIQIHNMYEVNFVNGADPVEMMVYVQSAPDTPAVASQILNLSNKVTTGNDLHVTIDADDTWPFAWYLRDMPNVAYPQYPSLVQQKAFYTNPVIIVDEAHQAALLPLLHGRYTGHEYILRWWFPEDYKTLTWNHFFQDAVNPGYWNVITQWMVDRRPFGPKGMIHFFLYVKRGIASPY